MNTWWLIPDCYWFDILYLGGGSIASQTCKLNIETVIDEVELLKAQGQMLVYKSYNYYHKGVIVQV